jgi:deazaflavin-dependent oxidoreductase (nitroreductase family)
MTAHGTRLAWISPFTKRVVNPLTRQFAGRVPGFALVTHIGRRSGSAYQTPLNVFRRGDTYVFALTDGPDVDWVRNVLAAGGCTMRTGGRTVRLVEPALVHDPSRRLVPQPVSTFIGMLDVQDFLVARIEGRRACGAAARLVGTARQCAAGREPPRHAA